MNVNINNSTDNVKEIIKVVESIGIGKTVEDIIKSSNQNNQIINDGLTDEERIVSDALVSAWNNYLKLSKQHPSDLDLFAEGIQKCQQTLFMRILRRDYPEAYPSDVKE